MEKYAEAKSYLDHVATLIPDNDQKVPFQIARAFLAFKTGENEQAYQYLDIAKVRAKAKMSKHTEVSGAHFDLMEIYALRGEYEPALNLLGEIRNAPYRDYLWLKMDPETQEFVKEPKVQAIIHDMKTEMDSMRVMVITSFPDIED